MNIAHLLPATAHFPLQKHNGRYEWALRLARFQAEQGHEVTIYCHNGSTDSNKDIKFKSISSDFYDKNLNNLALIKSALRGSQHDVFHSHFDYLHYFLAGQTDRPIIATQHWFPDEVTAEAAKLDSSRDVTVVPVTNFMAQENKRLNIPTGDPIYHGIDLSFFQPTTAPKRRRYLCVGRIAPHKGTLQAVKLAKEAGVELDIIGKINNSDRSYWAEIEPFVDGKQICYLGEKSQSELRFFYANARALLFPSPVNEAFGQVTIEALASGTPVITSASGTSRELIQDGVSGFTCSSENDYLSAMNQTNSIDRRNCRKQAEKYDVHKMVENYQKLYLRHVAK